MIKELTHQKIEQIVDEHLQKIFHPSSNVSNQTKAEIKKEALKLSQFFIDIITQFNHGVDNDDFVDRVLSKVDLFVTTYDKLLNAIPQQKIAGSVGVIWNAFFINAIKELKDDISNKLLFEYGENEIRPILIARMRRK